MTPIKLCSALTTSTILAFSFLVPISAQVIPDGTTSTTVESDGTINDGDRAGNNLFHSFQEFAVPNGGQAFFNNALDIVNIFSRVTGGNLSNIDGLLGANGTANLFLINPAGIIFGENARLSLGGSFFASTADSIVFSDGEFSAVDLDNPPLLTINAPLGLGIRDNPATIVNRSFVQNNAGEFVGLEVAPRNNLTLVGGNIDFEGGEATASGGNIFLGGLSAAGTVTFNEDGTLSFPENVSPADINLSDLADVDVRGTDSGSITINARDLTLEGGDFGGSQIRAGILDNSGFEGAQAGNININATGTVNLSEASSIKNEVSSGATGNSGDILINASSFSITDEASSISSTTFGQGNAGNINLQVQDEVNLVGGDIFSQVGDTGTGDGGSITVNATNISLLDGSEITASTFGQGNAGAVNITATDTITFDGQDSEGFNSGAFSTVETDAVGDAGGIDIRTANLTLTNGGKVIASTSGQGNAGIVNINASDNILVDGEDPSDDTTAGGIFSNVSSGAVGNAGGVEITTANLTLTNGGVVNASTFGQGNAGTLTINASGTISADGQDLEGFNIGIFSDVNSNALGNAGGVEITTTNLTLTNGAIVSARTNGQGDAGTVAINALDTISVDGEDSEGSNSVIRSNVSSNATGDAGGVTINTGSLALTNGGAVSASTFGQGNAGTVNITATDTVTFDREDSDGFNSGAFSTVGSDAVGDAGGVNITTGSLAVTNGGQISASTFGQGNAGAVNITATDTVTFDGENSQGFNSGAFSNVNSGAEGNAGGVNITTGSLSLTNEGQISASTFGRGDAGTVTINASESVLLDNGGIFSQVKSDAIGNAGGVNITTGFLVLTNGGQIATNTFAQGNGGGVTINATESVSLDDGDIFSEVTSDAVGNAGTLEITTVELSLINNSIIGTRVFGEGDGGIAQI
ncbi:MAG: beta strand repeat-containing protein, partial [Xenococcus sp. (in: cyanobacteria)]